jgi:hypothetical protein
MGGTSSVVKQMHNQFCGILAALAGAAIFLSPAISAQQKALPARIDPKAQAVLDRTLKALGGPAFRNFKTLTTRGRIFAVREEATTGMAQFESFVEYPDKRRFSYGKGKPVILINNGDRGWELDRYGLITQPPEQVRRWKVANRYSLENLLRLRIHDPGVLIQLGGSDFVDNVPTQVVDIYESGGGHIRLELNRQSFLPTRISYRVQNPKTGDWDDYADVYSDYQSFQGIMTPMHIARFIDGDRAAETFRTGAQYNQDYPPDYFQPPR